MESSSRTDALVALPKKAKSYVSADSLLARRGSQVPVAHTSVRRVIQGHAPMSPFVLNQLQLRSRGCPWGVTDQFLRSVFARAR